jgi:predicted PurR-regulated permease PerM
MAAVNGQLAASGLVGALTSLFISAGNMVVPDGNLKSLISVMAGMTASVVAFEILSWIVVLRLVRQRKVLNSLIPRLQELQTTIQEGIAHQIELMKQHNATAASLREVEKALATSSENIARVLVEIQNRSLDIFRDVGR